MAFPCKLRRVLFVRITIFLVRAVFSIKPGSLADETVHENEESSRQLNSLNNYVFFSTNSERVEFFPLWQQIELLFS